MKISSIKILSKLYLTFLLFILIIGFIEKLIWHFSIIGVFGIFIGFPITTLLYIFVYLKWRRTLIDNFEIFRAKHLLKSGEIHHKMYYVAQIIISFTCIYRFNLLKTFLLE
ncbi:hypothetical protein PM10SUCC1_15430 [Propionigenium maris DSM 9537]|uniref:Uncharacterized protein n=1 Tax=Propionigenium maris DSM 9537 TaxID=1123000 RepID=A0A9W6LMP3_9FUSO|nr:hypothetical protein [Propionigenium maris]GLI56029.1 hypothetical protein PM10SUCC1_15430 [Propionigenium maris DSM 9537]